MTKNKSEKSFYSLPEFEEWKEETDNWHTWRVKYYKGNDEGVTHWVDPAGTTLNMLAIEVSLAHEISDLCETT